MVLAKLGTGFCGKKVMSEDVDFDLPEGINLQVFFKLFTRMLFLVNPMSLLLCLSCSIGTLIEIIIEVILITAYFIS